MIDNGSNGIGVAKATGGAKALSMNAADNDVAPAFTLTRAELAALMQEAIEHARPCPLLVDKKLLAHLLGVSVGHIDGLRKEGMPTVMVGQVVRFEQDDVMAWLRSRKS